MHRHGAVNGDMYGVRHLLLNWVRDGLLYWVGHGLGDMHGVGPVDMHLVWHMHDLLNWVRSGNMNRDLHWVWDLLLDRVGSGYWDLDGHMDVLLHWVGLGHVYLDGNRPVDRHMNGVRYLLLNRVGLRDMNGYFDDFLNGVRHVLDNGVRSRNVHFDRVRHLLLNRVRNVFLNWVRNGDVLYNGDGFVHFLVPVTTEVAAKAAMSVSAVETTIETSMSVTQSDIENASFLVLLVVSCRLLVVGHCHFFFCFLRFFRVGEGQKSHQTGGHEL